METDLANSMKKYLHCQDSKAGKMVPRRMKEGFYGELVGEVVHFDFLHVGADGPLGTKDVGKQSHGDRG